MIAGRLLHSLQLSLTQADHEVVELFLFAEFQIFCRAWRRGWRRPRRPCICGGGFLAATSAIVPVQPASENPVCRGEVMICLTLTCGTTNRSAVLLFASSPCCRVRSICWAGLRFRRSCDRVETVTRMLTLMASLANRRLVESRYFRLQKIRSSRPTVCTNSSQNF